MTTPPEDRTPLEAFDALPEAQQQTAVAHFNAAAAARSRQWDEEQAIEQILGVEVDLDFQIWAATGGRLTTEDFRDALQAD